MRRHRDTTAHTWLHSRPNLKALFIALTAMVLLSACGRMDSSYSTFGTNTVTSTSTSTSTSVYTTPVPTSLSSVTTSTVTSTTTTTSYSCSLTLTGGTPAATVTGQTPVAITYTMTITPTPSVAVTPTITSSPTGAFVVSSLVPSAGSASIVGYYTAAGSSYLMASATVVGQLISCNSTAVTVPQAAPATTVVYRFDRANPPDLFYATSQSGPSGYQLAGPMFKIYSQAPAATLCTSVPVMECVLPTTPNAVTFLSSNLTCGGYPVVGTLGYMCSQQITGTTGLYRAQNTSDHRVFTTANYNDIATLSSQGWSYQGMIGYAPLQ